MYFYSFYLSYLALLIYIFLVAFVKFSSLIRYNYWTWQGVTYILILMRGLSLLSIALVLTACAQGGGPAPVTMYGTSQGPGSSGVHNVARGDTLWTISQRYNIVMRDIVVENGLSAPFELDIGQRLILPPPREYQVRKGDSVSEVARLFDVSASEIVRINDLRSPYRLRTGQVLRLPSGSVPKPKPKVPNVYVAERVGTPARIVEVGPVRSSQPVARDSSGRSMDDVVDGIIGDQERVAPSDAQIVQSEVVKPGRKPVFKEAKRSEPVVKRKISTPKRASSKFLKPVEGKTISSYGSKTDGLYNDGINIAAPRGAEVQAAADGEVVYAGNGLKGYGNLILVKHAGRYLTAYGHLGSMTVKKGMSVRAGEKIGTVGTSGQVKTPQLHFEIRKGTEAVNPSKHI